MSFQNLSNTLAWPDLQVNQSPFTRQHLLDAADQFFTDQGLERVAVSDAVTPYVRAYGRLMTAPELGWGLQLDVAPAACGTGFIFEAHALANYGRGWALIDRLHNRSGREYWSTSEKLAQFGQRNFCDQKYLVEVEKYFQTELSDKFIKAAGEAEAQALKDRFKANERGHFSGEGYTGHIQATDGKPVVRLSLQSVDADKIAAILALLSKT